MKQELIKRNTDIPELKLIQKNKADQIRMTFEPMSKLLSEFEERFNELNKIPFEEINKEICLKFKRFRLDIARLRTETGKAKDKAKYYLKLEDRAIMGVHNILIYAIKEMEDIAKEKESKFEIIEKKRLEALQNERVERLSKYVENAHERDLAKFANDEFEALFVVKKREYEARVAEEKKVEAERIRAELRKQKHVKRELEARAFGQFFEWDKSHIDTSDEDFKKLVLEAKKKQKNHELAQLAKKAENEKLKRRLEEIEKQVKIEAKKRAQAEEERRVQAEKERKALEVKLEAEKKAHEEERKVQAEKEQKALEALEARLEAEKRVHEEEAARLEAEFKKGDIDKVKDLILDLRSLKTKYSFKSSKNKKMYEDFGVLIEKIIKKITTTCITK